MVFNGSSKKRMIHEATKDALDPYLYRTLCPIVKMAPTGHMARNRVREVAEELGWSKGILARRSNLTQNVIRRLWRNPHHDASFSTLEKIADALGVSIHCIIDDDPEPIAPSRQTKKSAE
jgi:DNA-binding Xre family transcriptional regulator